jgi:hypothetical protein
MYLMPPSGSDVPQWQRIVGNFILNGPSGNRDLGNLFPGALPVVALKALHLCCTPAD